jgi:hypothetical protein
LGSFKIPDGPLDPDPKTGDVLSNVEYEAGTLLHELGHTLGLAHGGDEYDAMPKPNYISVMNYNFQFPDLIGERPLDYSNCAMASLNESQLNEAQGIGSSCPQGLNTWVGFHNISGVNCPPDKFVSTPTGPFDWNMSESIETSTHDIDCDGNYNLVDGFDDWSHLRYLLNSTSWKSHLGSGLSGASVPVAFTTERTAQSVLDNRISLLNDLNETTDNLPPIVRGYLDSQIGVSNYTTATDIIIPNNATSSLVVHNSSGSIAVENVTGLSVPTNATTNLTVYNATGSFDIQGTINGTDLGNATISSLPLKSNVTVNTLVDNATHAKISNSTGVIATNATGSYLIENATKIIIPGNDTNGATVQNGTSLYDLTVKSNDISEAVNKIEELSKTTDSSLGGVSNGDLVINSTIQRQLSSQLDNLKSVLEKQQGS